MQQGFTLVETLLYTAFIGMIVTSLVMLATAAFNVRGKVRAELIQEQNLRFAVERIRSTLGDASGITAPAVGASGSTLTLSMPSSTQNPTSFTLTNGTITMAQGTGTAAALISNEVSVSSLMFTRVSSTGPMVRIVVTGGLRNAAPSYGTLTVTTTAAVRR